MACWLLRTNKKATANRANNAKQENYLRVIRAIRGCFSGKLPPMAHNQFHDLLSIAAIELERHFAPGFDGADEAVEFIGRPNRVTIKFGDDIARLQPEKIG